MDCRHHLHRRRRHQTMNLIPGHPSSLAVVLTRWRKWISEPDYAILSPSCLTHERVIGTRHLRPLHLRRGDTVRPELTSVKLEAWVNILTIARESGFYVNFWYFILWSFSRKMRFSITFLGRTKITFKQMLTLSHNKLSP